MNKRESRFIMNTKTIVFLSMVVVVSFFCRMSGKGGSRTTEGKSESAGLGANPIAGDETVRQIVRQASEGRWLPLAPPWRSETWPWRELLSV